MDKKRFTPLSILIVINAVLVMIFTCIYLFTQWTLPGLCPGLCAGMTTMLYFYYRPTDKGRFGISIIFLAAAVLNIIAAVLQITTALC